MSRLSAQQLENARSRAEAFQQNLLERAKGKVDRERADGQEGGVFFAALFQLAGEIIAEDVDGFCDRADAVFELIEAHGQEPLLDEDWLGEVVGGTDTFYFSTDNLVSDLVTRPRKQRRKKALSQEERDRLGEEVENAILDEADRQGQNFERALATAHDESVSNWIQKIRLALDKQTGFLDFWTLRDTTGLAPTELFLALILGHEYWKLGQHHFYGDVTVELY